jgi:signal transduction histidine kinase
MTPGYFVLLQLAVAAVIGAVLWAVLSRRNRRGSFGPHRVMLRAVPDMMFVIDKHGVYRDYHAPEPALLIVPPAQFLGRSLRDLFPADTAERMMRCIAETLRTGEAHSVEYDAPVAGTLGHWEARIVGCDRDTVLCIVRDMTDRKRAEHAARQLREGLARVGRFTALGTLSGSLAHEINQPLASIMANAQAIRRMLDAPAFDRAEVKEALDDIVRDDRRAAEVLLRLRAVLTRDTPATEQLDVARILQEVVALVRNDAATRHVVLKADLGADLPPVTGDRVQVQQAALNLLINAFEAVHEMQADRRRVLLRAARENGAIAISVADSGAGLPADGMDEIYEPFYSTKPGGLGLGLAITRNIATAHGGTLSGAPNPEGGMTFTLRLPAA